MSKFEDLDFSDKSILKKWYKNKTEKEICSELIFKDYTNMNITYLYLFLSRTENLFNIASGILSLIVGSSLWSLLRMGIMKYSNYVRSGIEKDNYKLTGPITQTGPRIEGYMSIPTQINILVMTIISTFIILSIVLYIIEGIPRNKKRRFIKKYIDLNKSA